MATRYQKVGGMVDYAEAAVGRAYGYYLAGSWPRSTIPV